MTKKYAERLRELGKELESEVSAHAHHLAVVPHLTTKIHHLLGYISALKVDEDSLCDCGLAWGHTGKHAPK